MRVDHRNPDQRGESASTLLIFPAAVMVLVILTAIAVDLSGVHLAHRQLQRMVSQAADDAASAVDSHRLRVDGDIAISRDVAQRIALASLATGSFNGELVGTPSISFGADGVMVTIDAAARVPLAFSNGIPGAPNFETIHATGVGRLERTEPGP